MYTRNPILGKLLPFGIGILILTFGFFGGRQPFTPGAEPIGPYLNGIFPSSTPGSGAGNWSVDNAYPQLTFADPLTMIQIPDLSGFFVAGKQGIIWKISNDSTTSTKTVVLDITDKVDTDGDAGLVNMVLHPEFGQAGSISRGFIYLFYRHHPLGSASVECETEAYIRISRFNRPDGQENFDPNSELVLIQQWDPQCWHNGGGMFFDDEGFLHIAFGDAGFAHESHNSTQKIDSFFFGGLLRIDVDQDPNRSHPIRRQPKDRPHGLAVKSYTQGYFIPNENPWVNSDSSVLEEYFALGLRSPHRAVYDAPTGDIWLTDVGEGAREELNRLVAEDNLQWPFKEGTQSGPKSPPAVIIGNERPPVYEYDHSAGNSIIGGMMYRGNKFNASLEGRFIFGDHGSRNIYAYNPNTGEVFFMANVPSGGSGAKNGIASFATDAVGNIYVLKLYGTDLDGGVIYKLRSEMNIPDPPSLLSQTGAFSNLSTLTPIPGFMPYDINSPLWSDGSLKQRWIAIPNDGTFNTSAEQVNFSATTAWTFPPGTVIMKHFELPTNENDPSQKKRLETRFLVVKEDGGIYGLTYKWNVQGTEATLLIGSDTASYTITRVNQSTRKQKWFFPGRADCLTCHNQNAGQALGINTWQMNREHTYPDQISGNQLLIWNNLGIFSNPFAVSELPGFLKSFAIDDPSIDLETRVRSYLDANCAHCHRPNSVQGAFDARFTTPLPSQQIIYGQAISVNSTPDGAIVKPKLHLQSELYLRDNTLGNGAMPPLAKNMIDTTYIKVLGDWISQLLDSACYVKHLSDLAPSSPPVNGWGPMELDMSNGSTDPNDGTMMSINALTFRKGLGVHSDSEVRYDLNGLYTRFKSHIGVDDETCGAGSVRFYVFLDGNLAYQSPVMTQADNAITIDIDVSSISELKLIVDDGGDGPTCDHANWADARLIKKCDDGNPCTYDYFNSACQCSSVPLEEHLVLNNSAQIFGVYGATRTITTLGSVNPASYLQLSAGEEVKLQPHFQVKPGGTLQIEMEECD